MPESLEPASSVLARDLTKRFGNNDGVQGLDLAIPRGGKFGLLGPNGAGKSTTLKMLMGILRPDGGELTVLGQKNPADAPLLRARIGYVPERHYIYRWMCVGEVIAFTRVFYPTWNDGLCNGLLTQYGLAREKRVEQLSHGMTTKLALILALSHEPELLILDEPTTGLDPVIREEFLEGILHPLVTRTDRTVIFSSHIMSDIEAVSDTIAIINEGSLIVCRSREELLGRTKRVVLTHDGSEVENCNTPNVLEVIQDDGRTVLTIADFESAQLDKLRARPGVRSADLRDLSLEDVFKAYIRADRGPR